MASLVTVRIDKGNSPNLGFRLQGGKDFGTPLVIQKVNGGSPAERAGLIAGDSVVRINNIDVYNLRHKDAQDVVVRAGPSFEISVQRGGSTWKPSVVPTGSLPAPAINYNNVSPVTKTSLVSNRSENIGSIGTGHNLLAKPFSPQVNGAVNGGPKLVNKQYNTPLKLYSEESIAETLSAQTEVLSTGALGVNFKKNERNYDATNSEVLRALKEAESEPNYPDPEPDSGVVTAPNSGIAGLRHVQAPETRPHPPAPQLPPGQNICADCERLIVGVFVRIKDKNLHVECFKCSTCGTSLKNVGYYNINNKLYCDIHAKSAALKNQSNPNLVPITVPPGGKAPANAISSALSSHSFPSPSPQSPKLNPSGTPYQAQETKGNADVASALPIVAPSNDTDSNINNTSSKLYSTSSPLSYSNFLNKSTNYSSAPKPFSSVSVPLSPHSTLSRTAPLSPVPAAPSVNSSFTPSAYSPSSELCHAKQNENLLELDEISLQIPNQPPPPPPVPVFSQINVSIPYQSVSPQLDSIGSSPRSDYSSYSSSSGKNNHNTAEPREKIVSEIKSLTPRLKSVSLSEKQSPRMNYVVSNVETTISNNNKKVTSELFVPIHDYSDSTESLEFPDHLTFSNKKNHSDISKFSPKPFSISTESSFKPDHHDDSVNVFSEQIFPWKSDKSGKADPVKNLDGIGISKVYINSSITKDAADYKHNTPASETAPVCWKCNTEIVRGPFITALGKIWCPHHFICATPSCRRPLQDIGFVEERGQLYCEYCFEQYLAPPCSKCSQKIKGDCLKAIGKNFHPECFNCTYCGKLFGNSPFFLEDGSPYCEADWNELFTTKCFACAFPIEAGDRWVEALNNNYHSQCFNCTMCKKNLEGQSFFAKGGRPFCKNHAR